jgi:hypothetical protein
LLSFNKVLFIGKKELNCPLGEFFLKKDSKYIGTLARHVLINTNLLLWADISQRELSWAHGWSIMDEAERPASALQAPVLFQNKGQFRPKKLYASKHLLSRLWATHSSSLPIPHGEFTASLMHQGGGIISVL